MYSPVTIANYFIKKHSEDDKLTPMKLIKLTYIAYGWYLVLSDGEKLVNEKPQAWDLGPVMPSLYHNLKQYGGDKVTNPVINERTKTEVISDDDAYFLDFIWSRYGGYNGVELSAITHTKGTPWTEVYPKGTNLIIPDELIEKHYKDIMSQALETA
ncbi:Panacea domain-containing protein [Flavobacterium sp. RHBU_24]|uniref:Panacea domain-containing protein n=1 Tax=Flavobacterium sp. RHBU_24 TaxID=3391185 RepID=UPI0039855A84